MSTTKQLKKVMVARISDIPEKAGREVIIGELSIALFKLKDGKIYAIENKCPHKNGPLSQGMVSGEHVFCPLHDRKVNVMDGQVQKPDTGCVKTYEVELNGDEIHLYL